MNDINKILSNLQCVIDEIISIDSDSVVTDLDGEIDYDTPSEFSEILYELKRIYNDLDNLNKNTNLSTTSANIEVLKNDENWQNKQVRDFFVKLYPEVHNIKIGDFHKGLEWVIDYNLIDDNEPVDKAYLAGESLAEIYLEAYRKNENEEVDICAAVLEKALKKFENDFADDDYLTGGFVNSNYAASSIVGFDSEMTKNAIESQIQTKGKEWFENDVSNTSKAIISKNFNIDIKSLLENISTEENKNHTIKRK